MTDLRKALEAWAKRGLQPTATEILDLLWPVIEAADASSAVTEGTPFQSIELQKALADLEAAMKEGE